MIVKSPRYLFLSASLLLLVIMLLLSRKAGVNCDEVLHYNQSVAVCNYFATGGKDTTALDTPVTHLKYYGQSYDNITTWLIRLFNIEDIYRFRHLMSTIAGWLTIVITALLAIWISGYEAGLIVIALFAVSPTFLGHSQNNLKDIPFALGYISAIFFTFRFLSSGRRIRVIDFILLTLSIAFCISIRAGGLLLYFYLLFFFLAWFFVRFLEQGRSVIPELTRKLIAAAVITIASYFLGIILWPFALQAPLENTWLSYKVMLRFPDTFRQIFEGRSEWSDYMPWYYLVKSMLITIPVVVTAGLVVLLLYSGKILKSANRIFFLFLVFAFLFPVIIVIIKRPNLYSSWRHFLFLYPVMVVLSATGISMLSGSAKTGLWKILVLALLLLSFIHPARFILRNPRYCYLYYNQITGGLKGALGNYETDYYFVSQQESSEWLIKYLEQNDLGEKVIVGANFSVEWFFRNEPRVKTVYFRNEERSMNDWDYSITTNRYISPTRLKTSEWPPADALKVIYADGVPLSAIEKRKTKADLMGVKSLENGRIKEAIGYFSEAVAVNGDDEMIFYNFADALSRDGQQEKADSVLIRCLEINPEFEPALMFSGLRAASSGRNDEAAGYFERLIGLNRKYLEAYIELAAIKQKEDIAEARKILRNCLSVNPGYKPAIISLADTYRQTDPEVAAKYDELLRSIK